MRFSNLGLPALFLVCATPALAQEETAPPSPITVSGSASITSDYRFRGVSQSDKEMAIQVGITISHESGFYVGGGVGQFNVQIDDIDDTDEAIERLDDDDTSWKLFAGYRFNPYISIEAAYIDFGGPSDSFDASGSSGDYKVELSGFAPYVVGTLPLGPVELFAKVGYYFYDVDLEETTPKEP